MNSKLIALYKELPWLTKLQNEIGDPSVVKVQRLDRESAQRFIGSTTTSDDSYWIRGYFFDQKGNIVSKISPRRPGFFGFLHSLWAASITTTVEEALEREARLEEVQYIVLFGQDLNHYCQDQLYIYKMPKGLTASQFLVGIEEQRKQERKSSLAIASVEVHAEIAEVE